MVSTEFKINDLITLKLENKRTNIYVNNKKFRQCKYLLLNIPKDKIHEYDEINSIDDAESFLDHAHEHDKANSLHIDPKSEFWGHCSNLQAWYENDYDTRLLHRNLAFPLLKKLGLLGDPIAKKRLKDEIAYRFVEGNQNVKSVLLLEGYTRYLTQREREQIFADEDWLADFHPKSIEEWRMKAFAYNDLRQHENAVECFIRLLKISPNDVEAKCFIAYLTYYLGKDINIALRMFMCLIDTKLKKLVLCMIGDIYSTLGENKKALKFINKSLRLDDSNSFAWNFKGDALYKQDRFGEALYCFDRAIDNDSENYNNWKSRGKVLKRLNRYHEALLSFHKAFKLNQNSLSVIYYLTWLYAWLKFKEQALKFLSLARDLDQDVRRWVKGKNFDFLRNDPDFIKLISF